MLCQGGSKLATTSIQRVQYMHEAGNDVIDFKLKDDNGQTWTSYRN